jgi:integrase
VPWVENFIKIAKVSKATRQNYSATLGHLQGYAKKKKIKLSWDTFNIEFYHSFMEYLYSEGLVDSTTGKIIQLVKVFLSRSFDEDKHTNLNFRKASFKALYTDSDEICLSETEILKIYNLTLDDQTGLHKELLQDAKLLFVLNCFVGLRIRDLIKLGPHHVKNIPGGQAIAITTTKTTQDVLIPLHKTASEIYEKHASTLFSKKFHLGEYNERLRELGELAGLNDLVQDRVTVKGETTFNFVPKFKKLSAHCARRSFATYCYGLKIPTRTIMQVTGHKTESSFFRYVKINNEEHAAIMLEHFNKPQAMLATTQ